MAIETLKKAGLQYVLAKLKDKFVQIKDAVVSVNGHTPDTNGNVSFDTISYAENLTSSYTQTNEAAFTFRNSGGDSSIDDGDAWINAVYGNRVHTGAVEESITLTVTPADPESDLEAEIDRDTFVEYVATSGTFTFTYSASWDVDPEDYGITVTGTPASGDVITVVYVQEQRGTITVCAPQTLVSTGYNLFNSVTGYAHVKKYSDLYGFIVDGTYTALQFSTTLTGTRTTITPTSKHFTIPSDGYVFVTGGNNTDTEIYMTWSDWVDGRAGSFEAYTASVVDFSAVMTAHFPYGLYQVGDVRDEINFNEGNAISRIERLAYTDGNLDTVIATGRAYECDENYIYVVRASDVVYNVTVSNSYAVSDHGTEQFTVSGTSCDTRAKIIYGANLKNKLERDVLTISNQTLLDAQKAQIRNRLGLGNTADALPVANGGTGATSVADVKAAFDIDDLENALGGIKCISTLVSANNGTKVFKFTGTCAFSMFTSGADAIIRSHTHGYCTGAGAVSQTKQPSGATGISFTNATNKMTVKNESQYTMFVVLIAYGNPDNISLQE